MTEGQNGLQWQRLRDCGDFGVGPKGGCESCQQLRQETQSSLIIRIEGPCFPSLKHSFCRTAWKSLVASVWTPGQDKEGSWETGAEGRRNLKIKLEEEQFAPKVLLLLQLNYLFEGQLQTKKCRLPFFLSKIAFRYSNRAKLIIITFNIIDFHLDEFQ